MKADLDSKESIHHFVNLFYHDMLQDELLAPIFLDIAKIELSAHLPLICQYWEKLLLGERDYRRHTMNIHRALDAKHSLRAEDFQRWLKLFTRTVDLHFVGPSALRAKSLAAQIAGNMEAALSL